MGERIGNTIGVPAHPVNASETLEDYNYVAQAVVEPTGFLGFGKPIFVESYDGTSEIARCNRIVTIKKGQMISMWFGGGSDPADKIVNNIPVEEVFVYRIEPPEEEKNVIDA